MNALPVLHDDEVVLAETDAPVAAREIQTHRPTGAIQERSDSRWNAGWIHRRQQEGEDAERQAVSHIRLSRVSSTASRGSSLTMPAMPHIRVT